MASKAIIGIVVIVVIAAIGYFVFFQQPVNEFDTGFAELTQLWAAQNIDLSDETFTSSESFKNKSKDDLLSLKVNILDFKSNTTVASLKDLADIHIAFLDYSIKEKELDPLFQTISSLDSSDYADMCGNLGTFNKVEEVSGELEILAGSLNQKINSFNSNYSSEAASANLAAISISESKVTENMEEISTNVALLSQLCI